MNRKIATAILISIAFHLNACHRTPNADYLRDYAQAHDLIDSYHGNVDKLDRADLIIDALLKSHPEFPHAHVEKARLLMNRGYFVGNRYAPGTLEKSEQELRTAISLDPDFCDSHIVLGYVLYQMHKYSDALKALGHADDLACANPWRLMNRVDVDLALQHYDEAAKVLDEVPAAIGSSPPALRYVMQEKALEAQIWIAFSKGNQADTLDRVREEVKFLRPDDAWGMGNASSSFVLAGAFDEAIAAAREALRRMHYSAAEHTLGVALFGDSLWRSSHPQSSQENPTPTDEWLQAESLVDFDVASKELWGSLANHDLAFRKLLQQKIMDDRVSEKQQETGPNK